MAEGIMTLLCQEKGGKSVMLLQSQHVHTRIKCDCWWSACEDSFVVVVVMCIFLQVLTNDTVMLIRPTVQKMLLL